MKNMKNALKKHKYRKHEKPKVTWKTNKKIIT